MERAIIIEANDVWKTYGSGAKEVEAVRGVSFELRQGEIVSIMGPSGCGKTTLLNCLAGIDTLDKGTVTIDGVELHKLSERERDAFRAKRLAFVFQFYNLVPVLTALENVELPLLCLGVPRKEAQRRARQALVRVGLKERESHRPGELSGGQRQRIALARAIVHEPKAIFADEPTGALDRKSNEMIMDLIDHINRQDGISFVIVTHNPTVASYAHNTFYMDSGKIISERRSAALQGNRAAEGAGLT